MFPEFILPVLELVSKDECFESGESVSPMSKSKFNDELCTERLSRNYRFDSQATVKNYDVNVYKRRYNKNRSLI